MKEENMGECFCDLGLKKAALCKTQKDTKRKDQQILKHKNLNKIFIQK